MNAHQRRADRRKNESHLSKELRLLERAGQVTSTRVRILKGFSLSAFLEKHPAPPHWRDVTVHIDPSALRAYGVTDDSGLFGVTYDHATSPLNPDTKYTQEPLQQRDSCAPSVASAPRPQ